MLMFAFWSMLKLISSRINVCKESYILDRYDIFSGSILVKFRETMQTADNSKAFFMELVA